MKLSSSNIKALLINPERFTVTQDNPACSLTLSCGKKYSITKISDSQFSVERAYQSEKGVKGFWQSLKTKIAWALGTSNRQKITKWLIQHQEVFDEQCDKIKPHSQQINAIQAPTPTSVSSSTPIEEHHPAQPSKTPEEAARVVQRAFRRYQLNKDIAKKHRQYDQGRLFTMTHPTKKGMNHEPVVYYHDPSGQLPPFREPLRSLPIKDRVRGGQKQLIAKDEQFVELERRADNRSAFNGAQLDKIALALAPYRSCISSRVLNSRTLIAKVGGEDLFSASAENPIPINAFKPALMDLDKMHQEHIYLRDIKGENLTINNKGRIYFIDTDDAAIPALNNYHDKDDIHCTTGLVNLDILDGRSKGDKRTLKVGDDYAMLLTMIEATTDVEELKYISSVERVRKKTLITKGNKPLVGEWIKANIHKKYWNEVMKFLKDPVSKPLTKPLHEIIKWQ